MKRALQPGIGALLAACVVVVALSAAFAWSVGRAPDETSHLRMVRHHADHLGFSPVADWSYGNYRGHNYHLFSPVPHAVYVPFQWLSDAIGPIDGASRPERFVTRLGGLVVAVAQLLVTTALVRRMCRGCSHGQAVAIALAVNLVPQLRYVHAYVTTDAVTVLVATTGFALALRYLQRERITAIDAVAAGAVVGLIAHGRYNAFPVGVVVLGALLFAVVRRNGGVRHAFRLIGGALALAVLIAGAFHLHVYNELRNDHLLASVENEQLRFSTDAGAPKEARSLKAAVRKGIEQVTTVWSGLWASFAEHVHLGGLAALLLAGACSVGLLGLAIGGRVFDRAGRMIAFISARAGRRYLVGDGAAMVVLAGRTVPAAHRSDSAVRCRPRYRDSHRSRQAIVHERQYRRRRLDHRAAVSERLGTSACRRLRKHALGTYRAGSSLRMVARTGPRSAPGV